MNQTQLTPEESLALISSIIAEARDNFKEDGIIYILWGILIGVAGISQYVLTYYEYSINWIIWLLMPVGSIISFFYYAGKPGSYNAINTMVGKLWFFVLINLMILGFGFGPVLGKYLIPVILLVLAMGTIISGLVLKEGVLKIAGVGMNALAFTAFFIPHKFHSIVIAGAGLFFMFSGIVLSRKNRQP